METFWNFRGNFWKNLQKNGTETSNNFREKLRRNLEEILKIFEALLKICPEELQSLIRHRGNV